MRWILLALVVLFGLRAFSFAKTNEIVSAVYAGSALVSLTLLFTTKKSQTR